MNKKKNILYIIIFCHRFFSKSIKISFLTYLHIVTVYTIIGLPLIDSILIYCILISNNEDNNEPIIVKLLIILFIKSVSLFYIN